VDYFLHVLTATDASVDSPPRCIAHATTEDVRVIVGNTTISFTTDDVGGYVELAGRRNQLPNQIVTQGR
jgi:hypothetical protein